MHVFDEKELNFHVLFSLIFGYCRAESVYSDQYTGEKPWHPETSTGSIQRVPYFSVLKRVHRARDEKHDLLSDQLVAMQKR